MEERNDKGLYALIWREKNDPVRGVAEVVALSLLLLYILLAFLFKAPWAHWLLIPAIPADLISIVLRIKEHRNWQIFAVSSLSFF